MDYIEINISENGSLICNLNNNYISYKEVLYFFKEIDITNGKLKIENNNITLNNKNKILIIKNYKNNRDITLDKIIEQLKIEYRKRKREFLKNKKIKRIKKISIIVLIAATATSSFIINKHKENNEKNYIIPENEYTELVELENNNNDYEKIEEHNNQMELNCLEENINIKFESRIDSDKLRITKAYYQDIITRISNEYGIDPQIIIAIATQEMGIHEIDENSPAIGLMQIEKNIWNNETITAYNFDKKEYETLKVTEERLKDLEFNIRTGCMIFQNCLKDSNYNLCVAIQMYNFGPKSMKKVLKECYGQNFNLSSDYIENNNEWLEYRNNNTSGDKVYLEHILSYIENLNDIKCKKNTETIKYNINNINLNYMI